MNIEKKLSEKTIEAIQSIYGKTVEKVTFEKTNPDFVGDLTLVVFNFLKISKKKPEDTANDIGNYLKMNVAEVADFNVIKGFLNIVIADVYWLNYLKSIIGKPFIQTSTEKDAPLIMVEYSSPNTNKPLHLGHVRNNLLGYSLSEILKAAGNKVIKVNLVNDRGIHICKSMLAWQKWGKGETPESSGMKGDHLVGKYYVKFDKKSRDFSNNLLNEIYKKLQPITIDPKYLIDETIYNFSLELPIWAAFAQADINRNSDVKKLEESLKDNSETWFNDLLNRIQKVIKNAKIKDDLKEIFIEVETLIKIKLPNIPLAKANEMLRNWEANDKPTRELWEEMNSWVYQGFAETYKMLGVDFDKTYYESNTYILGKNIIDEGLAKGVLNRRADNSVYIDLTADGLDEKTLLRSDGTSVYITQDLGTAVQRAEEEHFDKLIYTVGNEQDYHFKVLFLILKKLGYKWADGLFHLSYGMVELPEGKMKSREGTVVDADDLMKVMIETAATTTKELGKIEGFTDEEAEKLFRTIGLGALKYFILKVDPKKKMLFNPAESIDFNGNTAPFIQYNYVRIQALLRKVPNGVDFEGTGVFSQKINLLPKERVLIIHLYNFHAILSQAAAEYNPAIIANYVYDLTKEFSQYYHDTPILKEEEKELIVFRLHLSKTIGIAIKSSMNLLGIEVPERM